MSSFKKETKTFRRLFIALAALSLAFSLNTCDLPMGLGDPIDWEPPVLTLVPKPSNPMYVRQGAVLTGTVTDNVGVDRVIMREASTGKQLFLASLKGENWEIVMEFTEEQNNEKIAVEIVAFDKAQNSGDQSIAAVTLIVDIGPPIIEDIWIQRTEIKTASLESYNDLKALETNDPRGERSGNVNRYQNGFFTIAGKAAEVETRIDSVILNIYDTRDPDIVLLELKKLDTSTNFSPRWLVSEEALLAAGEAHWPGYTQAYYNSPSPSNDGRYYYRVVAQAIDRGENESESLIRFEEEGYFVMWQNADVPKGLIDPLIGGVSSNIVVTKGATLPVEFFDDDQLAWAYTGLLTENQWKGDAALNPDGLLIMGSKAAADAVITTPREKLKWLRDQLRSGSVVINNWKQERYPGPQEDQEQIKNIINGEIDETSMYVQTGNNDNDNGQYVLFSLVADKKLDPHTNNGPNDTNRTRERMEFWNVDVVDENEPLIVFDTVSTASSSYAGSPGDDSIAGAKTGDSPEENTFPRLKKGSELTPPVTGNTNQYFELNGYTLRANKGNVALQYHNTVTKFRMAWIPAGRGDSYIPLVQNALKDSDPHSMDYLEELGIQYWDFTLANNSPAVYAPGTLLTGTNLILDPISKPNDIFTKQVFRKRFDVLGGPDDRKPEYRNFTYTDDNGVVVRENTTKLFIIYAEDNMGHVVFRQLRLLGNRTPPEITIYDITNRNVAIQEGPPGGLPDLNNPTRNPAYLDYYFFTDDGVIDSLGRERYEAKRLAYQQAAYDLLKNINPNQNDIAGTNTAYPRNTFIKYWVTAESNGQLEIANINMRDITFAGSNDTNIGHLDTASKTLSYIEKLSEVTQRVFLFTATDTLGNVARVQRTVAVTNAAVLNNITTTTQSGTYGIGTTITLQANFSNLVKWNGLNPPLLNVRFMRDGFEKILEIPTKTAAGASVLSLDFDFEILQGDTGVLQTMYFDIANSSGSGYNYTNKGTDGDGNNRPIKLPPGTTITDATRGDNAFIPRYITTFDWTQDGIGPGKSLQGGAGVAALKTIVLDGIRPTIQTFVFDPGGKTRYTTNNGGYYYKTDDVLTFTLEASKSIFTNGSPIVQFAFNGNNNTWLDSVPWQRSSNATTMVFSVQVPSANTTIPEGYVSGIRLKDVRTIIDSVGNAFAAATVETPYSSTDMNISTGNDTIRIDKTPPIAPVTQLDSQNVEGTNTLYYSANPVLQINANPTSGESSIVTRYYSLNAGVKWVTFPTEETTWTSTNTEATGGALNILSGQWVLQTRYIDRAGNEGAVTSQPIHVNAKFPDLKSITAVQPNGYYKANSTLQFDLAFDDVVWTSNTAQVTITLTNRKPDADNIAANTLAQNYGKGGTSPRYQQQLTATTVLQANANSTIRFAWNNIAGKEMPDGLYVSAVNFTGLHDRFGNPGGSGTASVTTGTTPSALTVTIPGNSSQTVANLNGANLKVDCLSPVITARNPVSANNVTGDRRTSVSNDNKTITITFDEAVQKGRGTITVRPHGNYAIPAVLENEGYYMSVNPTTGVEIKEGQANYDAANRIYVSGMNDVFNNMTTANRNYMITGGTLSAPTLSAQTGLSVGPYKKMTHGLKQGAGYTGNYNNTNPAAPNAPGTTGSTYMVPDTTTKWVLDYQYQIHSTAGAVANIRTALNSIGFRKQEIAVTSTNVVIPSGSSTVTITLPEPLLPGLQWDLFFEEGTFTDLAGNVYVPATVDTNYWFWSSGVQRPVIRVDRKSYDGRQTVPAAGTGGGAVTQTFNDTNAYAGTIASFNTVAYRIETETPGARIFFRTQLGDGYTSGGSGSITGAWTGVATQTGLGGNFNTSANLNWNGPKTNNETVGEWVRPNLIFRNNTNGTYTVTENGITVTQQVSNSEAGQNYYGFRSFNRDALFSELSGNPALTDSGVENMYQGTFTYAALQASKNYVAADARIDHSNSAFTTATYTSQRGYEGVFRTVIALHQNGSAGGNDNHISLCGTNVKSGIPSLAGFPVKDGIANADTRYLKLFYIDGKHYYWVSTEIVTPWYMQNYGRGNNAAGQNDNSYGRIGDATDWVTAGYGDLSYAFDMYTW